MKNTEIAEYKEMIQEMKVELENEFKENPESKVEFAGVVYSIDRLIAALKDVKTTEQFNAIKDKIAADFIYVGNFAFTMAEGEEEDEEFEDEDDVEYDDEDEFEEADQD